MILWEGSGAVRGSPGIPTRCRPKALVPRCTEYGTPRPLRLLVHSGCISDRNLLFEGQISLYLNIESAVRSIRVIDVIQYTEYLFSY